MTDLENHTFVDRAFGSVRLGRVDKLIGPEADGCDMYEAEIAC